MSRFAYSDAHLTSVLTRTRSIATVGVSANPVRPSNYVFRYLSLKGFRMIPVNPGISGQSLYGATVRESLSSIPEADMPVDMVDIFRRSDQAGGVVDEAIEILAPRGLQTIWMQIGVWDEAAAERAEHAGLTVIMDRCPKLEYQRLFGELRKAGMNTGIISSKL